MVSNEQDNNMPYAISNEAYTRDLDERKDAEVVSRDHAKALNLNSYVAASHTIKRRRNFLRRWTFWFNFVVVILLGLFIVLHELNFLPHYHGGFYCKDPKLSHKFEGDTITIGCLLLVDLTIPFFIMMAVELVRYRPERLSLSNKKFKTACQNTYVWFGELMLSMIFLLFFMEVIKGIVGEPRPHFFDTCAPDAAVNCTPGVYISKYNCTNTRHARWFVLDTIKSFPSGHTALAMVASIHLFFYFRRRLCDLRPRMLGPLMQIIVISWAIVCSFTRITDNRHHWWDVLAGAVLGVSVSYYNITVLCKNFKCTNMKYSRSHTSNGDTNTALDHKKQQSYNTTNNMRQENFDNLRQIT